MWDGAGVVIDGIDIYDALAGAVVVAGHLGAYLNVAPVDRAREIRARLHVTWLKRASGGVPGRMLAVGLMVDSHVRAELRLVDEYEAAHSCRCGLRANGEGE